MDNYYSNFKDRFRVNLNKLEQDLAGIYQMSIPLFPVLNSAYTKSDYGRKL